VRRLPSNPIGVASRNPVEVHGLPAGQEVDVDRESEFDGWADLGALRQAEDEMLIQRYASGEGRGLDMRPVRGFVNHVRRDLGPAAIICDVKMTVERSGHEVIAWYYFPDGETPAAQPQAKVTSVVTQPNEPAAGVRTSSDGLAALAHSTAPAPASPTRTPPPAAAPARITRGAAA
jgi:hypothetical protein